MIKDIDKLRRSFFWREKDPGQVGGGGTASLTGTLALGLRNGEGWVSKILRNLEGPLG
jgi:hypothetical protein